MSFLLEERSRLELLVNADQEIELQHVQDDDARKMLALTIDRMVIFPSKTMHHNAMGRLFDSNAYHKKGININDIKAQDLSSKLGRMVGRKNFVQKNRPLHRNPTHSAGEALYFRQSATCHGLRTASRASLHTKMPMYLRKPYWVAQ